MNRFRIFAFIGLLAVICKDTSAQKNVTEDEVSKLYGKARSAMETMPYRQISIVESFDDRNRPAVFKSITTTIRMNPDAIHTKVQTEDASGVRLKETIIIGNKSFSKEGGKEWKENLREGGSGGGSTFTAIGDKEKLRTDIVAEYRGKADDLDVDLYIVTKKEERVGGALVFVNKYWFTQDFLLVKEESESYYTYAKSLLRTITTYEYDPNIKVEAPIP